MYIVDPELNSFIEVSEDSHFPIQNLPYGVFSPDDGDTRVGVAIGEYVIDLAALAVAGKFNNIKNDLAAAFSGGSLNQFMAMGREVWTKIRERIVDLLREDNPELRDDEELRSSVFYLIDEVELHLPVEVSEFTDFYSSYHHAFNVGSLIRGPENALMPNWKHLPVAYHGRGSSVVVSGTDIHRPLGQTKPNDDEPPVFGPTQRLDFELEMGFFIGTGNNLGQPIPIDEAEDHIFGLTLVNDWSARDIQVWEYKPLGPFLGKNFASSISPWVVTLDAVTPFKTEQMEQDPEPLPYLRSDNEPPIYDINLNVLLQSELMEEPKVITKSNSKNLYWNFAQQLAHHSVTGCNMQTGDLLATGTISGPTEESRACLLELTELGENPLELNQAEDRIFLEDGDTVTMTGYAQGDGYRVGFGEVTTKILPSIEFP